MSDVERALELLIHDVRTPVGVAQGYVRLLREHRLEAAEDRQRALDRTMEALGRISQLCADATVFLGHDAADASVVIDATVLAASVDTRVRKRKIAVGRAVIDPHARVRVFGDPEGLAEAISVVLATVKRPAGGTIPILQMETRQSELRFVVAPKDTGAAAVSAPQPFDRWHGRDLAVPVACRTIDHAGGGIAVAEPAVVVVIPLEGLAA